MILYNLLHWIEWRIGRGCLPLSCFSFHSFLCRVAFIWARWCCVHFFITSLDSIRFDRPIVLFERLRRAPFFKMFQLCLVRLNNGINSKIHSHKHKKKENPNKCALPIEMKTFILYVQCASIDLCALCQYISVFANVLPLPLPMLLHWVWNIIVHRKWQWNDFNRQWYNKRQ